MKSKTIITLAVCLSTASMHAQTAGVSLQTISDYNRWGWNTIVMQNDFITVAAVPEIGGRIMQYDLDSLPSIYINSNELRKTYTPSFRAYHNFGGYKTWPSPQSRWPGEWPPPPTLDFGAYTYQADSTSDDSVSVTVTSPIEQWVAPGIQYERKATIYPGTSRVKMEQTIINKGTSIAKWGMWSIIQSVVNHPGKNDYGNFWVYFPINPNSVYGESGVLSDGFSNAWKGEAAPGVYGVQFSPTDPNGKKVYADPHKGWIAYANISDTVVFARTFEIFEGAHYPDSARVTVYVSDSLSTYMEVEVKSPLVDLAAGGGRYTFTENWWAAKVRAPVIDVNSVGAIAGQLSYNSTTQILSAVYGVFYEGAAKVIFLDENGQVLSEGQEHNVSPLSEFQLQETITIPNGAKTAEIQVRKLGGDLIGILDSIDVTHLPTAVDSNTNASPLNYRLEQNYPNPFNPATNFEFQIPNSEFISFKIYDLLGREVAALVNRMQSAGEHTVEWNAQNYPSGVYFYSLRAGTFTETKRLLLLK